MQDAEPPLEGGALTTAATWDGAYADRDTLPFDEANWRQYVAIQVSRRIEAMGLESGEVCEIGGGDARMLTYLARRHPASRWAVIDYSPVGCALARRRAAREQTRLDVYEQDLFDPSPELLGRFDVVITQGVVEHFTDLAATMRAIRRLLKERGRAFTLVPNLASPVYGRLCRRWSEAVFRSHVPHDLRSLAEGHQAAGLHPIESGHLGSVEFGMLSMAFKGPGRKSRADAAVYLWLTRLSKAVHWFEYTVTDLPASRWLSPFLYLVSERRGADA